MPRQVYVNIGSNQGDRKAHIERAVALIAELAVGGEVLRSSFVESRPWGFSSDNDFVNLGIVFSTALAPEELLDALQLMERRISEGAHRDADGNYIDRDIDIDIIAIDGEEVDTPRLQVPHPRMLAREFVMEPLRELSKSASWLNSYLV
ncbi:MAG: 2-amino-4-hydroxy-6-hydroxymethyldihydropteridine diphosphokinase [Bacteroides sp.]|nr:2-amino-4-hydroxy-6-hydroxymethyldihydropteridine diphosphokinase [Bacteroides sp.]